MSLDESHQEMEQPQSTMPTVAGLSRAYRSRSWAPLLTGLVLGLIVGLLIGWVWWPVEWSGASLADLLPEQRYAYISAIADGYAMYSSPDAAMTAQRRLAGLGERFPTEVVNAIDYYGMDPTANAPQILNLAQLAEALGIPVDASMLPVLSTPATEIVGTAQDATVDNSAAVSAPADGSTEVTATPAEDSSGIGWLQWLLVSATALLLFLGGAFLLRRTQSPAPRRRPGSIASSAQTSQSDANGGSGFRQRTPTAQESDDIVGRNSEDDDYIFADEPDSLGQQAGSVSQWRGAASAYGSTTPAADDDDEFFDDSSAVVHGGGYADDDVDLSADDEQGVEADADDAELEDAELDDETDDETGEPAGNTGTGSPVTQAPPLTRPAPSAVFNVPGKSNLPTGGGRTTATPAGASDRALATYTTHFQPGVPDYAEAYNITDPTNQRYVGEFGIMVSSKNRAVHNNPDEVIALEVWLYDKSDDKLADNQTRLLLSEYASDRELSGAFTRERNVDLRPIVPQTDLKFEIDGRNLKLMCAVVSAKYDRAGVFRELVVNMAVVPKR